MAMINTLLLHLICLSFFINFQATLSENPGSNSILIALLDSQYTRFSELVDRAFLLEPLERALMNNNITIFAPTNEALDRHIDPRFKSFMLDPNNAESLQSLVLHHIVPIKLNHEAWPDHDRAAPVHHVALSNDQVELSRNKSSHYVSDVRVVFLDSIEREDGVIHGIDQVMIPTSVQIAFVNSRRKLRSAVEPEGAPEMDERSDKKATSSLPHEYTTYGDLGPSSSLTEADPPSFVEFEANPPSSLPGLAITPTSGPRGTERHRAAIDGQKKVNDLVQALINYGGYNEIADILVNLTGLSTEMGKLIGEGYKLTILAPNDEAMAKVTTEQLMSEAGAVEEIAYNHVLTDYLTDTSVYNAVRRFGTVEYRSLKGKVLARESDGSVKFGSETGSGRSEGYLMDPDIYADGSVSVQGIDGVLMSPRQQSNKEIKDMNALNDNNNNKGVKKTRRGKLIEVTCGMLEAIGQESRFATCEED